VCKPKHYDRPLGRTPNSMPTTHYTKIAIPLDITQEWLVVVAHSHNFNLIGLIFYKAASNYAWIS